MDNRIDMRFESYIGTRDHSKMYNRDLPDQHPIDAITGLAEKIDSYDDFTDSFQATRRDLEKAAEEAREAQEEIKVANADTIRILAQSVEAVEGQVNTAVNEAEARVTDAREHALQQIGNATNNASAIFDDIDNRAEQVENWANATMEARDEVLSYLGNMGEEGGGGTGGSGGNVNVDLTDYVQFTDYATRDKAGVIKANVNGVGINTDGSVYGEVFASGSDYNGRSAASFVSKGTLENRLAGIDAVHVGSTAPENADIWIDPNGDPYDMSEYLKKSELAEGIAGKQDKLVAGANIIINGNVISAVGGGGGDGTTVIQGGDMYAATYDKNGNGIVDNAEKVNGHTVLSDVPANAKFTDTVFSGNYNDLTNKPSIPSAVTESTVSGWGFSKFSGRYADLTGVPDGLGTVTEDTVADWGFSKFSGNYADLSGKPTIPEAVTEQTVSGWGFSKFDGTYGSLTGKPSIPTSATVSGWGFSKFSGSYNDLSDKPTIPSAVTEQTVSGWGFTKNDGTYSKPSGGIPKSDLAAAVQTSLGKADTAIQDISGKQDKLTAGANITITNNTISASNGITVSASEPTAADGQNGDIWIVY